MARNQEVNAVSIAGFGELPLAESGNTFKPSGWNREQKNGRKHVNGGHTQKPTHAELDITLQANKTFTVQQLNAMDDVIITVTMSDNTKHMMSGAYNEEAQEIGDGETKAKFNANQSTQIA